MQNIITQRLIITNISTLLSNSIMSQGLSAIALLLTARQLGVSTFGQYASTIALLGILSVGFNLGLDTWLLREGSRVPTQLAESVGSVVTIKFFGGAIWLLVIILLSFTLLKSFFPPKLVVFSAITVWVDSLLMTSLTAFKTSLQNTLTLIIESTSDFAWLLGTLALITMDITEAEPFLLMRILILMTAVIISTILIRSRIGLGISIDIVKRSLRSSPPYAISEFLALASMRIDVIIIAVALGTYYAGLYSPAISIASALFFVPASIYMVMVPVISNQLPSNKDQAWQTIRRFNIVFLFVGIASGALLYFGSWIITPILGESYYQSEEIIKILSFLMIFKSLSFGMAAVLLAIGHQDQRTIVQVIAVLINVILNLVIVKTLGINGVAAVYVFTEFILFIGYFGLVQYHRRKSVV